MTIQELMQKRAKVWETAKSFVDTHEDKNGRLSAEDTAAYNRMEQEIEDLTASIERQQRAADRDKMLSQPINSPIISKPAQTAKERQVVRLTNTRRLCLVLCVQISATFQTFCRKALMLMAATLCRRNMTNVLSTCLKRKIFSVHWARS